MRIQSKRALIAAIMVLVAGQVESEVVHRAIATKIDRLFRLDTLNSDVNYVEHLIGPAKYVGPDSSDKSSEKREYAVNGCDIVIGFIDRSVKYLGIKNISNQCQFPLQRFIPHLPVTHISSLNALTFGAFERQAGQGIDENNYIIPCLVSCGNSADPAVQLIRSGAHVDEFVDILLEQDYPYTDKQTDVSLSKLQSIIIKNEDIDYNRYGKIECDQKYRSTEAQLFHDIRIKNVYVGFDLDRHLTDCH